MKIGRQSGWQIEYVKCFIFCLVLCSLFGYGWASIIAMTHSGSIAFPLVLSLLAAGVAILSLALLMKLIGNGGSFRLFLKRSLKFACIAILEALTLATISGLIAVALKSILESAHSAETISKIDSAFDIFFSIICYALILFAFTAAINADKSFKFLLKATFTHSLKSYLLHIGISAVTIAVTILTVHLTSLINGTAFAIVIRIFIFSVIYAASICMSLRIDKGEKYGCRKSL